jgi:DNA-binding transcriptional LysR family regulator
MLELFDEFYCVASYLSITKAAAMLNMSQPNLSRHVRQLERETGFELLDRSSGCVKLTGAGRKLADGYPDIRRQLTELIEDCRRFAASPIKQITAHEPPYMDNVIGPYYEYLGKLNEQGARIEFRVLHRISLREAIESRLIDVGVAYFYRSVPPQLAQVFTCEHLCDVPLGVWVDRNTPLGQLRQVAIEDLATWRILMPNDSYHPLRKGLNDLFGDFGTTPRYEVVNTLSQTEFMATRAQGCLFIFPLAVKDDPRLKARFDLRCAPLASGLSLSAYSISNIDAKR